MVREPDACVFLRRLDRRLMFGWANSPVIFCMFSDALRYSHTRTAWPHQARLSRRVRLSPPSTSKFLLPIPQKNVVFGCLFHVSSNLLLVPEVLALMMRCCLQKYSILQTVGGAQLLMQRWLRITTAFLSFGAQGTHRS